MPGSKNINIYQGDTYIHELRIKDSSNVAINITSYTFTGQIRMAPASTEVEVSFTTTITNGANGIVQFSLAPNVTSNIAVGTYYYDFQQNNSGVVTTLLTGKAVVEGQVSRV